MQFHLLYAGGLLKSAGNKNRRSWEKHSIRRFLHLQMKNLWETHPALREYAARTVEQHGSPDIPFLDALAKTHEKSGVGFIPLITAANGLVCELDILFLRPNRPGHLVDQKGDLDNRMKTLLDALRIPENRDEIVRREGDEADPNPMYCLLQNDDLITSLKVSTDTMLFTMDEGQAEACLVIRVNTANVDPFGSPWELHL